VYNCIINQKVVSNQPTMGVEARKQETLVAIRMDYLTSTNDTDLWDDWPMQNGYFSSPDLFSKTHKGYIAITTMHNKNNNIGWYIYITRWQSNVASWKIPHLVALRWFFPFKYPLQAISHARTIPCLLASAHQWKIHFQWDGREETGENTN
jgi:hypothetical protein